MNKKYIQVFFSGFAAGVMFSAGFVVWNEIKSTGNVSDIHFVHDPDQIFPAKRPTVVVETESYRGPVRHYFLWIDQKFNDKDLVSMGLDAYQNEGSAKNIMPKFAHGLFGPDVYKRFYMIDIGKEKRNAVYFDQAGLVYWSSR